MDISNLIGPNPCESKCFNKDGPKGCRYCESDPRSLCPSYAAYAAKLELLEALRKQGTPYPKGMADPPGTMVFIPDEEAK
ncbi:MAG: hypothetical protein WC455_29840 [Dehalococcoidia bacterium]|jgi:hypothetical protein